MTEDEEVALRHRAKAELRTRILAVRRALPREARERRSSAIAEHVIAHAAFERAKVVAAYVAMRGEVDPAPIVRAARAAGKSVVLPRVDWEAERLTLHAHPDGASLEESGMGFWQPAADAPVVDAASVDLVLVPSVAVDERGMRIGMGKAFYDRLLPTLPNATSLALAFDFQLLAEVPSTPGDVKVALVATDTGVRAALP
jgi:5-formyltetrahydrofolate cyclo-ligase